MNDVLLREFERIKNLQNVYAELSQTMASNVHLSVHYDPDAKKYWQIEYETYAENVEKVFLGTIKINEVEPFIERRVVYRKVNV